jgi:hypothetical protein
VRVNVYDKTSSAICYKQTGLTCRGTADATPPIGAKKKQFFEGLSGKNQEWHKLPAKSKENQWTEEIKKLLKNIIDPVNIKIGIMTIKILKNGDVLSEADSEEEIERLHSQIRDKYCSQFETYTQKRRNLMIIIYSVPEFVTLENVEDIILAQNPDLKLQEGDIKIKFNFKSKRNKELSN